jgi:hypothetical protein
MRCRFVVEDKNAATHLVRNAMGGKDKDMVCALLTLPHIAVGGWDAVGLRLIRRLQFPQAVSSGYRTRTSFVVEDKNAATHLVRNAMGGKDKDMVCALLTLPSPYLLLADGTPLAFG